jgi:lipoate-protein ligase A
MRLFDFTLDSPQANVALDEALLESAEATDGHDDVLRFWESPCHAVVVGRGSNAAEEVDLLFCEANDIPVVRRCSGGAAIVAGPGCLMYALVLNLQRWPKLSLIDHAHRLILQRIADGLHALQIEAHRQGISDLVVGDRKISGNSLRRKRHWILYHGTILCGLSAELIQTCLRVAPRQPEYRRGRTHRDFVDQVTASPEELKRAIASAWDAQLPLDQWPQEETSKLMAARYSMDAWNIGRTKVVEDG